MIGLLVALLWYVQHSLDRTPPDIRPFAYSAATRTADAAAARRSSGHLTRLTSALPWAVPLGTSVADSCETENENPFLGRAVWAPIHCARTSVLYLAFDGDIRTRLHQFDAALADQRWTSTGTLTQAALRATDPSGTPSPAPQRTCLARAYLPAGQKDHFAHNGIGTQMQVSVLERPCTPMVTTGDLQIDATPQKSTPDRTLYLTWHPLLTTAVLGTAYSTHRYVAAFSLTDSYAVQLPKTPSPTPTPTRPPPCLSGSGTCH